jgi:mRNA interferase MazF
MALLYPPRMGQILICDYRTGFNPPEMVKVRPVIVISPKPRTRITHLCTVIPLSTTPPDIIGKQHCEITLARPLPKPFDATICWAKGDMLATVGYERLSMPMIGKDSDGMRRYIKVFLDGEQLTAVRNSVLAALGFS